MFSYQHHMNDFDNATRHLSRVERSIYRDLIELYYKTEAPLSLDLPRVCKLVLAFSNEEATYVEQALNEFFHKTANGWAHVRCELEIDSYKSNTTQKSLAGKASAAKRAAKRQQIINGRSTDVGTNVVTEVQREANVDSTNHKPLTINHKPILKDITQQVAAQDKPAKKSKEKLDYSVWPEQPSAQIFNDWQEMRKGKGAKLSQTVLDSFGEQFRLAATFGHSVNDCLTAAITSSWTGFKYSWMQNQLARGVQVAGYQQPKGSGNRKEKVIHSDRVREEARVAIERIDAKNGVAPVYANGGFIREQGGQSGLDHLF